MDNLSQVITDILSNEEMENHEKDHRIKEAVAEELARLKDEHYLSDRFEVNIQINATKSSFNNRINQAIESLLG